MALLAGKSSADKFRWPFCDNTGQKCKCVWPAGIWQRTSDSMEWWGQRWYLSSQYFHRCGLKNRSRRWRSVKDSWIYGRGSDLRSRIQLWYLYGSGRKRDAAALLCDHPWSGRQGCTSVWIFFQRKICERGNDRREPDRPGMCSKSFGWKLAGSIVRAHHLYKWDTYEFVEAFDCLWRSAQKWICTDLWG